MKSVLTKKQKKVFGPVVFKQDGRHYSITATVQYDDECGNGHNSFSITGEIWRCLPDGTRTGRDCESCGCIHEDIAQHFPVLAPLIKWHLCSSDGPLHYLANTLYLAGDKDYNGLRKGEFRQMKDKQGVPFWMPDIPKDIDNVWTRAITAVCAPDPITIKYIPYGTTGEGKARELNSARHAAIWPDATDAELTSPDLTERLIARLPGLMKEFKAAIESLGFTF